MNHKLNCNDKCLVYLLTCNVCLKHMFDKQSRNLGIDGTITKAMVVNIKSMTHVCRNIFLSIFMRRDTIVRWEMSLLHWFTKLTHQALYREKTIGEVLWRQWRHGDWTLKTLSKIAFCVILAPGFKRIVISTRFTQTILVPIIIISTFITIIAVAVIIGVGVGVGVCVCVCVFVCVCLRPSTMKASSVWNSWDCQGTDQRCCVEGIGFLCRFPSSLRWNAAHNLSTSRFTLFVH